VRGGEEEGGADAVVGVDFWRERGSHLRALRWFMEWLQRMEVLLKSGRLQLREKPRSAMRKADADVDVVLQGSGSAVLCNLERTLPLI
jgi:hypothetical protein